MDSYQEISPSLPPFQHLISAFFAMESTDCLISLSRDCGNGCITNEVQFLIWKHCVNEAMSKKENKPSNLFIKNFLKKVIIEVESSGGAVLDELYEQFAYYITSVKDGILAKENTKVCKTISFLSPDDWVERPTCLKSRKLEVPLQCSLNMLEGDTGCSIWPSSLYLSEFILSYPEIFTAKSCFEVGSGVGLVGIVIALVKASQVILTDGDMLTLANLKLNLKLNQLTAESDAFEETNWVKCKYLSWESASESELQNFTPDIVLGADVIYNPQCIPHLVRVLSMVLKPKGSNLLHRNYDNDNNSNGHIADYTDGSLAHVLGRPIAYIATVIRNVDTYNYFLNVASQEHLLVVDITEKKRPLDLLPYMQSYDRFSVRLLTISMMES